MCRKSGNANLTYPTKRHASHYGRNTTIVTGLWRALKKVCRPIRKQPTQSPTRSKTMPRLNGHIESYDMDGNNGLSYEEIKDVSFGAKIQSQIFFLKNLKKNVKIETKKPKIKRKYFRYNLNFSSNFF